MQQAAISNVIQFRPRSVETTFEEIEGEEMVTGDDIEGLEDCERMSKIMVAAMVKAMQEDGMDVQSAKIDIFVVQESIVAAMARGKGIEHPFQYVADNIKNLRF